MNAIVPERWRGGEATALVRAGAFAPVLQHLAGPGVDADLVGRAGALHVEGVAQAAAATFLLQFLVGDDAGPRLQGDAASVRQRYVCGAGQPVAGESR